MPPTSTLKQPRSSTRNIDARATPAVIAIFGPTASGKSAVAAALGERLEGVLVGADAMQVYQGVPILTNQSPEPTELVSIWPLDYDASVGDYAPRAHAVIDAALAAGGFPVVVGGTGLYLRAALAELDIPPPAPPGTRERLESLYERDGGRQAHALLTQRDPLAAAAVHVNDQRRVIRALELVEVGRTLHPASPTLWTEATRYPTLVVGLEVRPELLEERIVEIYKSEAFDIASTVLLDIGSLTDLLDQFEYLQDIAARDDEILTGVTEGRIETRKARIRTRRTRRSLVRVTAQLASRTEEQRQARDAVAARERDVTAARDDKSALLARVRQTQDVARDDIRELAAASEQLEKEIRAAQRRIAAPASSGSGRRPASGFIWPVDGVLTSGFGQRWGRLHAGIDVGVGFGTAIRAVALGTVVYSGWLGGYGNLVVVDHGNGLSSAYGHQQRIYAGLGQSVAQGESLGEVGSTGNSTGPHLHFEVRINGLAVDPLGYL